MKIKNTKITGEAFVLASALMIGAAASLIGINTITSGFLPAQVVTCPAPTNVTASVQNGGVQLSWQSVSGATGYSVKLQQVSRPSDPHIGPAITIPAGTTSKFFPASGTGALPGGVNYARVQSVCQSGGSAFSDPAMVSLLATRPDYWSYSFGFNQANARPGATIPVTGSVINVTPIAGVPSTSELKICGPSVEYQVPGPNEPCLTPTIVTQSLPAVSGGEIVSAVFPWSVPAQGYYKMIHTPDIGNTVIERNEGSPKSSMFYFRVTGTPLPAQPDYIMESVVVEPNVYGHGLSLTGVVKNTGTLAATNTSRTKIIIDRNHDGIYQSTESSLFNSNIRLTPGASDSVRHNGSVIMPLLPVGAYTLQACADAQNQVPESNESNNCAIVNFSVAPIPTNAGYLKIVKNIQNAGGGTAGPNSFAFRVNGTAVSQLYEYAYVPGTYTVTEIGIGPGSQNYTGVFSGDCSAAGTVTITTGAHKTCTITNTYVPPCTVTANDSYEPNNANPIGTQIVPYTLAVTGPTNLSGNIYPAGDEDWYRVSVPAMTAGQVQSLKINLTNATSPKFQVFTSTGAPLTAADTQAFTGSLGSFATHYYVRVRVPSGSTSATSCYKLDVSLYP